MIKAFCNVTLELICSKGFCMNYVNSIWPKGEHYNCQVDPTIRDLDEIINPSSWDFHGPKKLKQKEVVLHRNFIS